MPGNLLVLGHPFSLRETFRISGRPGDWHLSPVAGAIGLLEIPERSLGLLTPLISVPAAPFAGEIDTLRSAPVLAIKPGMIEFMSRQ
jgi:hypothetical protein